MSLLEKLKDASVIVRAPVVLQNAEKSDFYFDIKRTYGDPVLLQEIAVAMIEQFLREANCVACEGYGGLPLGTAISLIKGYSLTLVRQGPKKHGTRRWLDGHLPMAED